jgi:hypothetical protein
MECFTEIGKNFTGARGRAREHQKVVSGHTYKHRGEVATEALVHILSLPLDTQTSRPYMSIALHLTTGETFS